MAAAAKASGKKLKAEKIEEGLQALQQEYKIEGEQIRTVVFELDALKSKGILVDVDTSGFGMFTVRATYSELGVPREDMRAQRIKAGHKSLLPKSYIGKLDSLGTRISGSAQRHSLRIPAFGKWQFLTAAAYWSWREDYSELVLELEALKQKIVQDRATILEWIREQWTEIGIEAWDSLRARAVERAHAEGHKLERTRTEALREQRDVFIKEIAEAAVARFPENGRILEELRADYTTGFLQNANELREAQLELDRQDIEIREKNLKLTQAEEQIRTMREAEIQHARERLASMRSPIDEALDQIMAKIYAQVQDLLATYKKYGYLYGRSPEKARKLKDLWEVMSVRTNPELEGKIAALMHALPREGERTKRGDGPTYDSAAVGQALIELSNLTVKAVKTPEVSPFDVYSGVADLEVDGEEDGLVEFELYDPAVVEEGE